jgi:plasmid replication initiation protein
VIQKGLAEVLPTGIQKSYNILTDTERDVLNTALGKYRPSQSDPILVGGVKVLRPALRLLTRYRLVIEEIKDARVMTNYTRWLDAVQLSGAENQEVYVSFSPRFEHTWLQSKKHLLKHAERKPANIGLRSQYSLRLYSWAKKQVKVGTKRISLEELRKVLGLESVKDADIIQAAPLPVWANLRQRALDVAVAEINRKTDISIEIKSMERTAHRRVTTVTFAIKEQAIPTVD